MKHIYEFKEFSKEGEDDKYDLKQFMKDLEDWKKNPDKYTTPEYETPDGSKMCIINSNEYVATGVIVDSHIKAQIGQLNTFTWDVITPVNIEVSEIDPYGEENWGDESKLIKRGGKIFNT